MPTWGQILQEIGAAQQKGHKADAFDVVRRKYLDLLSKKTGRNVILYASKCTQPSDPPTPPQFITITEQDVQSLMEVVHGLKGEKLDIILHTPGGSPVATDAIVSYLRSKFPDIRVIVPQLAMSAGTMLACSANRIVMGRQSSLGPTDPQMILPSPLGGLRAVPAHSILDQFNQAQQECRDPQKLTSWLPILSQYGPGLIKECENAITLSNQLVAKWLEKYMFAGQEDAAKRASEIATHLADHKKFMDHGKHINREEARQLGGVGLIVDDLEADQELQDLVLSVFHATTHTMGATPAVKIVENHMGRAFVSQFGTIVLEKTAPAEEPPANSGRHSPRRAR